MREIQLIESKAASLELSPADAEQLRDLGQRLASSGSWWGAQEDGDSADTERSVIKVEAQGSGLYRIVFWNVVGVIRLQGVQLQVAPKIPLDHFLYLIDRSGIAPRTASALVGIDPARQLIEILARWCLAAAEQLLRRGLRQDYKQFEDEESAVRGQLMLCQTALETLRGRPVAICAYEELSDDAPLNRLVKGACQRLAGTTLLATATRARARAIVYRMDGIGPVQPADFQIQVDRITRVYETAVPLAKLVLRGMGASIQLGQQTGTAFLLRTPELIEAGVRGVVAEALKGCSSVTKGRMVLGGTGITMNPDLVFDRGRAVGDVKYRYLSRDWERSTLYQSISFATTYRCRHSVVVGFVARAGERLPPTVTTGDVQTMALGWVASRTQGPLESVRELTESVSRWYAQVCGVDASLLGPPEVNVSK